MNQEKNPGRGKKNSLWEKEPTDVSREQSHKWTAPGRVGQCQFNRNEIVGPNTALFRVKNKTLKGALHPDCHSYTVQKEVICIKQLLRLWKEVMWLSSKQCQGHRLAEEGNLHDLITRCQEGYQAEEVNPYNTSTVPTEGINMAVSKPMSRTPFSRRGYSAWTAWFPSTLRVDMTNVACHADNSLNKR